MRLLQLNLNEMKTEEEVHSYLKEQLHFPEHYGNNLDALYDMLTEGRAQNVCVELTRCAGPEAPLHAFEKRLEKVMEDAAQTMDERDGKLYAVFADFEPLDLSSPW